MIMKQKCPYCGSEMMEYDDDDGQYDCDSYLVAWDCHCEDCGKSFIVSEAYTLSSRIIAKDNDELEELLERE